MPKKTAKPGQFFGLTGRSKTRTFDSFQEWESFAHRHQYCTRKLPDDSSEAYCGGTGRVVGRWSNIPALDALLERASAEAPPPTVDEYFKLHFGVGLDLDDEARAEPIPVHSPAHPEFTIETGCGVDCKRAIDAAVALVAHVRAAYGEDRPDLIRAIRMTCNEVVCCYVYG